MMLDILAVIIGVFIFFAIVIACAIIGCSRTRSYANQLSLEDLRREQRERFERQEPS